MQRSLRFDSIHFPVFKIAAAGDVVTVTAKFWYVSDFGSNATEYADGYVRSVNCALRNSRIPVRYKR